MRFLFHLDLILHACKILFRYDRFGILNFATKQGLFQVASFHCQSSMASTTAVGERDI